MTIPSYDHLSYAELTASVLNMPVVREEDLGVAEKQANFELQKYARQRFRDIWIPRRDGMHAVKTHSVQGFSVGFNALTNLTQTFFNYRNPTALLTNAFRFAVSTLSEIRGHILRGEHTQLNSVGMQNVIWNHANQSLLGLIAGRPIQNDGTLMEITDIRNNLVADIMNDPLVLKNRVDYKPGDKDGFVDMNYRAKVARLLDCQMDPKTGILIKNEDIDAYYGRTNPAEMVNPNKYRYKIGDTYSATPMRLSPDDPAEAVTATAKKPAGAHPSLVMA